MLANTKPIVTARAGRRDARRAGDQGEQDDRQDDHLQQADEEVAEEFGIVDEGFDRVGEEAQDDAGDRAQDKADQDPREQIGLEVPIERSLLSG